MERFGFGLDLYCIDFGPPGDLMFWDRFARTLKSRIEGGRACILLLGSGEKTEGLLGGSGAASREAGELPIGSDQVVRFERGMREELQSTVTRLTDEGLSAVGFSGLDRNFLGIVENIFPGVRIGDRALESLLRWVPEGVLPVVSCAARTTAGRPVDIHPIRAAVGLARALSERGKDAEGPSLIYVAQRVTDRISEAASDSNGGAVSVEAAGRAVAAPSPLTAAIRAGAAFFVTHPDLPGSGREVVLTANP